VSELATIAVYIPTRGYIWHRTAAAMSAYQPSYVHNNTGVVDARQQIVDHFLSTRADVLVMCDDDVVPPANWDRIASHVIQGRADVCGAVCPVALEGTVLLPNVFRRDDNLSKGYKLSTDFIEMEDLQEVDAVGTGLICIDRRVLEDRKMREPFKASFIKGGGEDVRFCRRAKDARYRVMVDFDIWCDHRINVDAIGLANAYMEVHNLAVEAAKRGDAEWTLKQ
jgi:hypothetical protein